MTRKILALFIFFYSLTTYGSLNEINYGDINQRKRTLNPLMDTTTLLNISPSTVQDRIINDEINSLSTKNNYHFNNPVFQIDHEYLQIKNKIKSDPHNIDKEYLK